MEGGGLAGLHARGKLTANSGLAHSLAGLHAFGQLTANGGLAGERLRAVRAGQRNVPRRACGLAGLRACGLAGLRACGLAGLRAAKRDAAG
ncbi:hypothetical protein Pen01_52810 [Phytomonospora endophytica]|nr:hypothetical protein Pen01_52810 [Phytomonospora endophytica]